MVLVARLSTLPATRAQSPANTSVPQSGGLGLTDWDRNLRAQPTTGTVPVPVGRMGTSPTPLEQQAESVEQSRIFTRLGSGLPFLPAKVGPVGGIGGFRVALSQRVKVPLFEVGVRPEDAEIKLGRLYLDWRTVTLAYLVSDNVEQSLNNRRVGHVMVVRSELALILQVTDTVRLALGGEVGWLPFRNEVGFTDPLLDLDLNAAPLAAIQIAYEMPTPTWTCSFNDTFTVRRVRGELTYRYEERTSNTAISSYYEHLGTFSLVVTF